MRRNPVPEAERNSKDQEEEKDSEADDKSVPDLPEEPDFPHLRFNGREGRRLDVVFLAHAHTLTILSNKNNDPNDYENNPKQGLPASTICFLMKGNDNWKNDVKYH